MFFEPKSLQPRNFHTVSYDTFTPRAASSLQSVQRQMWRLLDALDNVPPARVEHAFAVPAHLPGATEPVARKCCCDFTAEETVTLKWAATERQLSPV